MGVEAAANEAKNNLAQEAKKKAGPETNAEKEKFGQKMKIKMKALGEKFKKPKK